MSTSHAASSPVRRPLADRQRLGLLALSIVLIAFNLRPVFSSLSVVLPDIVAATGMSAAAASALTTLPVISLGAFAMVAPWLGRRLGLERTLLACMGLITAGTLLRGSAQMPLLFVASAMAGIGIAVANVLLSALVKRDFDGRTALMMGLYTMAVCAGAACGAGLTVPLQQALGLGWQGALAMWTLPAAVALVLWVPRAWSTRRDAGESGFRVRGLWSDVLAWQVTLFMGLQSALAYSVMGWLAPMLRERGLAAATAGFVVSLSVLVQVPTCLVLPTLAQRQRNQVALAVGLAVLTVGALWACMFAPMGGIWGWAVLLGIAQGGTFSLALTMIVMRSPDARVAAQLSGMAQGVGYLVAATGPMLVGLLRAWTGSFRASALLFGALGVALVLAGAGAGRARFVKAAALPR
ncbi:CP family cyanate transporter-like MFS transporter [Pseudacidovorax sp. 1753]|uniref:CynX/NimT family MFS transporter n=1 Tax=Pseudacidovorax sp. 1753 TaxID=3156419 RepID=UPI003395456D